MATTLRAHRRRPIHFPALRWCRPFELRHLLLASLVLGILFHLFAPSPGRHVAPGAMPAAPLTVR